MASAQIPSPVGGVRDIPSPGWYPRKFQVQEVASEATGPQGESGVPYVSLRFSYKSLRFPPHKAPMLLRLIGFYAPKAPRFVCASGS